MTIDVLHPESLGHSVGFGIVSYGRLPALDTWSEVLHGADVAVISEPPWAADSDFLHEGLDNREVEGRTVAPDS